MPRSRPSLLQRRLRRRSAFSIGSLSRTCTRMPKRDSLGILGFEEPPFFAVGGPRSTSGFGLPGPDLLGARLALVAGLARGLVHGPLDHVLHHAAGLEVHDHLARDADAVPRPGVPGLPGGPALDLEPAGPAAIQAIPSLCPPHDPPDTL